MKKLVIVIALFLPASAFAVGGACPTAANYLNPATNALVTLSSLGVTSCYFISAAGNDANAGTSEGSPWLHAPGMSSCASVCAGVTPAGGIGFIFRGGDSWHYGNSGASPYVGASSPGWNVHWSGSSGNPIYWGIDLAWFSGGSWTRPIMNGDNPTSSTGVGACTHDEAIYTALSYGSQHYNTFDDLEFTGFCWHGNQSNSNEHICCLNVIYGGQGNATPSFNTLERNYIHGWSHVTFSCSLTGGEPTGNCAGATLVALGSNSNYEQGDVIANNVIDGADTDKSSACAFCFGGYDFHNNVIRYIANGVVTNNTHVFHDNLEEYLLAASDGISHTNATKFNSEWLGVNAYYNNVWRNLWLTGACEVTRWMMPSSTDYVFNNVQYGAGCAGNFVDLASTYGTGWTSNIFNETWVLPGNGPINANGVSTTVNFPNVYGVANNATTAANFFAGAGTINYQTDLIQTPATAASQYPSGGAFPYAPVSGAAGIGAGTNKQANCAPLLGSSDPVLQVAGAACQKDTTFAVAYNSTTHSVIYPARSPLTRPVSAAWDIGAYQFVGSPIVANPVISPASGTYGVAPTVTITDSTAGATICYTVDNTLPTANGAGTCTHGTTYSAPFTPSLPSVVKAIGSKSGSSDSGVTTNVYSTLVPSAPTNLGIFITGP